MTVMLDSSLPENDSKLVPTEPTAAMLDAAVSFALNVSVSGDYNWSAYMRDVWLKMLASAPKSDPNGVRDEWIPVSERLPEQHEWVLVSDGTWSAIGTYRDDEDLEPNKRWMDESAELIESNGIKITHWQPLPQPPKGKS